MGDRTFSIKHFLISCLLWILIVFAGVVIFDGLLVYIFVILAFVVSIYYYFKASSKKSKTTKGEKKSKAQNEKEGTEQISNQNTIKNDTKELNKNLLQLNIKVRIENLPHLELIEIIIDKLRDLIPKMLERFQKKEITWQTEKIAATYLPDLINSFILLNSERRIGQSNDFQQSLEVLKIELLNIENLISNAQIADFDMKAGEISMRFSNILK
ncbi:MAG: hypothetical protein K8S23_00085 [Candidatus Cloacimonetes bacterium]|nr:hypothetical protein [Candidatus Cloacimonadota bacterium]